MTTLLDRYKKLERYEHDREALSYIAHEHGLTEPDDQIIIENARHVYECAEDSCYYMEYFERDERFPKAYAASKKDFKQLERFYKKYCL